MRPGKALTLLTVCVAGAFFSACPQSTAPEDGCLDVGRNEITVLVDVVGRRPDGSARGSDDACPGLCPDVAELAGEPDGWSAPATSAPLRSPKSVRGSALSCKEK